MSTQSTVVGGAIGAGAGALLGFFTAHALRTAHRRMHAGAYSLGGAVVVGALGAYLGSRTAPALPAGNNTSSGAFWNTLTPLQQQNYKTKLFQWMTSAVSAGNWPSSVESPSQAGIATAGDLDDASNLALVTDGFQTVNHVGPGDGTIDQATFNMVTA